MKPVELIYRVKITAGMMDLAYRSKVIWISGVTDPHHALQTAIAWAESTWYPDWLSVNLQLFNWDTQTFSQLLFFKRQFNILFPSQKTIVLKGMNYSFG
jgi:hypothetical protein